MNKKPPRVVLELKSYRFVVRQRTFATDAKTGDPLSYTDELVLEKRNINAMEEPYWQEYKILETRGYFYNDNSDHNLLVEIIKELLP